MKQVFLDYSTGAISLIDAPIPLLRKNGVIVRTLYSAISSGTETLMIKLAKKSLIGKAMERPDLVRQVIDFAKNEGILNAYREAIARLKEPVPLGYSSVGIVEKVGENAREEFRVGDLVACAGHGYASHSELSYVPRTLCVKVPEGVKPEHAAFSNIGSIALHSVRLAKPEVGKNIAVIGLGLLGQFAAQIAKISGCNVFGIDIVEEKVKLGIKLGMDEGAVLGKEDVLTKAQNFSEREGFDSVIVFASTKSSQPLYLAARLARVKGKIIVPGWVKLSIPRQEFYDKELDLIVPRSSGPGLYDPQYESGVLDYPLPFVRWTVKRNMKTFLRLVEKGLIKVDPLITHIFNFEEAEKVYEKILKGELKRAIGILFKYKVEIKEEELFKPIIEITLRKRKKEKERERKKIIVGFIGAGTFAQGTLLPILSKMKEVELKTVCTATPVKVSNIAKRWKFKYATTDYRKILEDPEIDAVFITTRHDLHAKIAAEALKAGKYVFVEKPLAMNETQLKMVIDAYKLNPGKLMVGFNRRFSPFINEIKKIFRGRVEPLVISMRINAGYTPLDSWVFDPVQGGGRIIGEICHFIDLALYLTESPPIKLNIENALSPRYHFTDNLAIVLKHKDESLTSIIYTAAGTRSYSRELIEVFGEQTVAKVDNFKKLTIIKGTKRVRKRRINSDRGHKNEMEFFVKKVLNKEEINYFHEYVTTTLITFKLQKMLRNQF